MSSQTLVIKGGHVIDPAGGFDGTNDVDIRGGKIQQVSTSTTAPPACRARHTT